MMSMYRSNLDRRRRCRRGIGRCVVGGGVGVLMMVGLVVEVLIVVVVTPTVVVVGVP